MPSGGVGIVSRFNAAIASASRGIRTRDGIVVSQHHKASTAGAEILRNGGNAVDAAVATAFALGVVEPWMSGLGGVGYMLVGKASEKPVVVDFSARSPSGLDIADFPLGAGISDDLFPWTRVIDNRNTLGPLSICAPTMALGMELAWKMFGTQKWRELIAPAITLARTGFPVDWYAQLMLSSVMAELRTNLAAARTFLGETGTAQAGNWLRPGSRRITMEGLADTLETIGRDGAQTMLDGEIAQSLVRDVQSIGGVLEVSDIRAAMPSIAEPASADWHEERSRVWTVGAMSGGKTGVAEMLKRWSRQDLAHMDESSYFEAIAEGGIEVLKERLACMGHSFANVAGNSCTTSFCVIDADGLAVATTVTLVSLFGSKVLSPSTGILLNNGISWFDPEPGHLNSIAAGKQALTNMAPTFVSSQQGGIIAIAAAGGRRIAPAISQVIANVCLLNRSMGSALAAPRLDFGGEGKITADSRLDKGIIDALSARWDVTMAEPTVFPYHFGIVTVAESEADTQTGYPEPFCPNAGAQAGSRERKPEPKRLDSK